MGGTRENGVNIPAGRLIYERCGNNCQIISFKKSIAEGTRFRYADVDLLHQSRRQGIIQGAPRRIGKSQAAAFRKNRASETALAMAVVASASIIVAATVVTTPVISTQSVAGSDEE